MEEFINNLIERLKSRKSAIQCDGKDGLIITLQELGFEQRKAKTPGHRVFVHQYLNTHAGFTTHSIDCGHRPTRPMKTPYVTKTISLIERYKEQLIAHLEEQNHV